MTAFEYASALISIVVGLAVARVLGGVGAFLVAKRRSSADWVVAGWYLTLLVLLIGWWHAGWLAFRDRPTIDPGTLYGWSFATALFYLAAYILVPDRAGHAPSSEEADLSPLRPAFYLCLAAHFVAASLITLQAWDFRGMILMPTLVGVAAAGAWAKTDRMRALHLLVWFVALSALVVSIPTIG